jgi:hypothetical protein
MTGAAATTTATAAPGTAGAHTAAGATFVPAALEPTHGHNTVHVGTSAGIAVDRFIASKNQFLEFHLTTAAFILVDRHGMITSKDMDLCSQDT